MRYFTYLRKEAIKILYLKVMKIWYFSFNHIKFELYILLLNLNFYKLIHENLIKIFIRYKHKKMIDDIITIIQILIHISYLFIPY